jgi:hypothetical protein
MRRCLIIFFVVIITPVCLWPQDIVRVTGTAQEELPRDKSRLEIERKVREMASIDALEKAFGRIIIQGNSTYITNLQTGQKVETNTVFNTIANTSVRGEVVEILDEKFTDITGSREIDGIREQVTEIRCDIEIKAREITTPPVKFISSPLGCLDEKCKTTSFKNNDKLYLFFTTPMSGYLTVYLDDKVNTFCLYPYTGMPSEYEGGVPVAADRKYFLFSDKPEFDYFPGKNIIPDVYQLEAFTAQDMNRLFIIFSKNPMNKPTLRDESEKLLDKKDYEEEYRLPKSLPSEDFQRWLNSYRSAGKADVQVQITDITISK